MKRLSLALIPLALWLAGCGGASLSGGPPPISIAILPTSASVPVGVTAQFTATVMNASNTGVTWQVNGVTGGSATAGTGTISTSGLYTAPASVPSPATVTVTAVAQASASTTASAQVTITPTSSVTVTPAAASIAAGATQQFTATVQNVTNPMFTWQVNGVVGGNATVGTITTAGLYTAPLSPPDGGTVTVTAVLQSNPNPSGSATVTISFSNATLTGQYTFSATGTDTGGFFLRGGIFTADGNGNLASGIEDVNDTTGVFLNVTFTGTYSIGPDGRGTAAITAFGSSASSHFRFAMFSNKQGALIQFDNFATAAGTIDKQDQAAFSAAALGGSYAFDLSGLNPAGNPLSRVGQLNLDGSGGISGLEDINSAGIIVSNDPILGSSNYSVAANGRGTAQLATSSGTRSFVLYVVSANALKFLEVDFPLPAVSGDVLRQQNAPFSTASLSGPYSFLLGGTSTRGGIGLAGRFTADGNGGFSAGVEDVNDRGSITPQQGLAFTGSYTPITPDGRGTATITTSSGSQNFTFYLVSPGQALLQETDSNVVANGTAFAQQGGPFSPASVKGHLGFIFSGINSTAHPINFVGQLTADGNGGISAGVEDVNNNGSMSPGVPLTGNYTVASNGRGTATIITANNTHYVFYVVNASTTLFLGVDTNQVVVGPTSKQF